MNHWSRLRNVHMRKFPGYSGDFWLLSSGVMLSAYGSIYHLVDTLLKLRVISSLSEQVLGILLLVLLVVLGLRALGEI